MAPRGEAFACAGRAAAADREDRSAGPGCQRICIPWPQPSPGSWQYDPGPSWRPGVWSSRSPPAPSRPRGARPDRRAGHRYGDERGPGARMAIGAGRRRSCGTSRALQSPARRTTGTWVLPRLHPRRIIPGLLALCLLFSHRMGAGSANVHAQVLRPFAGFLQSSEFVRNSDNKGRCWPIQEDKGVVAEEGLEPPTQGL